MTSPHACQYIGFPHEREMRFQIVEWPRVADGRMDNVKAIVGRFLTAI
jgi:hypothetical protein